MPKGLLKDDTLVKVDVTTKMNYLRVHLNGVDQYIDITSPSAVFPAQAQIYDAAALQAFDAPANANKQIWLTFHVPDNARSGDYRGTLSLKSNSQLGSTVHIELTVLPFDLQKPVMDYGLYYMAILRWKPEIGSKFKTMIQYKAELQNVKDHGVLYPTLFQGYDDYFREALKLRRAIRIAA